NMLLIYLPQTTPRSEYVFDMIFGNEFGIKYDTTNNVEIFENHSEEKLNYSANRIKDEIFIRASPLLAENFIANFEVPLVEKNEIKILFPSNESCDANFDIFSSVFYMLSRYEEYLPFVPDKYGRFKSSDSFAFKNNFLHTAVVDRWVRQLKDILQKRFPLLKFNSSKFEVIVTYDIDVAYKFKGRSFKRNIGSVIKDLLKFDLQNIKKRLQTFSNKCKDPWDTYDYLHETIVKNNLNSIFFFLLGNNSMHDRNLTYNNPVTKNLIEIIKSFSEIGIHPSFKSSHFTKKILIEKRRLEKISGKEITKSRQHFLKFSLPDTYRGLIESGIKEDYSMGFPYAPGFRAGTSKPFYFYDLKNERSTGLKIFPITLMDGNFTEKEYPTSEKILESIDRLIREVKNVGGTFISIWHNHTVSDTDEYRSWRNIHSKMINGLL
ncbi:MAG: polysaccharide deacetylase family protein, partial [Ginsengibacter sp.]